MSSERRNKIRAAVSGMKPDSQLITVAGEKIELRSPTLGSVIDRNVKVGSGDLDRKEMVAMMIIQLCYVPGTEEQVFDEADIDMLVSAPFNSDLQRLNDAVNKMVTSGDVTDTKSPSTEGSPSLDGDDGGVRAETATGGSTVVDGSGSELVEGVPAG